MRYTTIIVLCSVLLFACRKPESINKPVNIAVNESFMPLSANGSNLKFGWQLVDSGRNIHQYAYQILVASNADLLSPEKADFWNTGKIVSDASQDIAYSGRILRTAATYFWAVQLFDSIGKVSGFVSSSFETALSDADWKAKAIMPLQEKANASLFRKTITLSKSISAARLYATALGAYTIHVNGKKIGKQYLAPGWTNVDKTLQYQVYDLDSALHIGENIIGAEVAKFWNADKHNVQFLAQLKIVYSDGTVAWFNTDDSWQSHESPVIASAYAKGEKYDATKEIDNWLRADNWQPVKTKLPAYNIVPQRCEGIEVRSAIAAAELIDLHNGSFVVDFGETLSGWVAVHHLQVKGATLSLQYLSTFNAKSANAATVIAEDTYVTNKDEVSWEPNFSYQTFRYVRLNGLAGKPALASVEAKVAWPSLEQTGNFSCSDSLLNRIYRAIVRTGRNNITEMLAGLPDAQSKLCSPVNAQAFATTGLFLFDIKKCLTKYLSDIRTSQGGDGRFRVFSGNANSPGWPDVIVHLPWSIYLSTGDKSVLAENYDAMVAWHASQQRESDAMSPPYMHNRDGMGDTYATEPTLVQPFSSAYYYYTTSVLSNVAEVLGKYDEATTYMELAGFTKDQFNQSYLTYHTARYWSNTQTAHVLPLAAELCPLSHSQRIADYIAKSIKDNNNHVATGVLTTHLLLSALSSYKHSELAYDILTQTTKPSLGYMLLKGSSTIWNSWDGNTDTDNYQLAFAAMGAWLFSEPGGLKFDKTSPGYKHITIEPTILSKLKWTEVSQRTPYGALAVKWEKVNGELKVTIEIPANTAATLKLPVTDENTATVLLDNKTIVANGKVTSNCPSYIKLTGFDTKKAVLEIASGKYVFELR